MIVVPSFSLILCPRGYKGVRLDALDFFIYLPYSVCNMVVRMRSTKSHRNNRRSHDSLSSPAVTVDKNTNVAHLRHRASTITGQYKGRTVIDIQSRLAKKAKKAKTVSGGK